MLGRSSSPGFGSRIGTWSNVTWRHVMWKSQHPTIDPGWVDVFTFIRTNSDIWALCIYRYNNSQYISNYIYDICIPFLNMCIALYGKITTELGDSNSLKRIRSEWQFFVHKMCWKIGKLNKNEKKQKTHMFITLIIQKSTNLRIATNFSFVFFVKIPWEGQPNWE